MTDIDNLTALGIAGEIWHGRMSAAQVTEAFLARIAAEQPAVNAFVEVYAEDARRAAAAADAQIAAGYRLGPLHGVPVVVKDLVDWQGRRTSGGSKAHADRIARATAPIIRHMLAQGMIILGKTQTVEFAFGGWGTNPGMGTPVNPWDREVHRVPGGSSSGTAVAVAAGLAPWGIGTDTGGSVRLPAAFCGLVGLKTTGGGIDTAGIQPLSPSLDTVGPLARSVADAAVLDHVLRGLPVPDLPPEALVGAIAPDLERGVAGLRLGSLPASERDGVEGDMLEAYDATLERLAGLGATITPVSLPFAIGEMVEANGVIMAAEAYAIHGVLADDAAQPLGDAVRARVRAGRDIRAADYIAALQGRATLSRAYTRATAGLDAVITPSMRAAAIQVSAVDEAVSPAHFTRFGNYLDLCAAVAPNGMSGDGMPLSAQTVCASHREHMALRIAATQVMP